MLKNRIQYTLLCVFVAVYAVFLDNYYVMLLLTALCALPVLSCTCMLAAYRKVRLNAGAPFSGGALSEIAFSLENRNLFPTGAVEWELILENNLSGSRAYQYLRAFPGAKTDAQFKVSLEKARTGKINIITQKAKLTDFLGLFSISIASPELFGIYIYPELFEVQRAGPYPAAVDGDCASYSQTKRGPDVNEIFSMHEYIEGDDLRKIHWKLSAKTDMLLVRDFGLPLDSRITLLMELMPPATSKKEAHRKAQRTEAYTKAQRTEALDPQSGEALSLCLDVISSLSMTLAQDGIIHHIAWYDAGYQAFHNELITCVEDLQAALPGLLEAKAYDGEPLAMQSYCRSANQGVLLYYITAKPQWPLISNVASGQRVQTIVVGESQTSGSNHTSGDSDIWPKDLEVVRVLTGMQPDLALRALPMSPAGDKLRLALSVDGVK